MPAPTRTLTLRLAPHQQEAVRRLAEREGVSEEEAILRLVEQAGARAAPSMLDRAGDLIGSVEGPPDLSTNETYMEGFGAWRAHGEQE
jgi:hypothetical protein